jgi:hypothetical protein
MGALQRCVDDLERIINTMKFEAKRGDFDLDGAIDDLDEVLFDLSKYAYYNEDNMPAPRFGKKVTKRFMSSMKPKKRKRKVTGKSKILNEMADKAWKKYKKNSPKGKRTYIQIRSQVSRSREYKRKTKGM